MRACCARPRASRWRGMWTRPSLAAGRRARPRSPPPGHLPTLRYAMNLEIHRCTYSFGFRLFFPYRSRPMGPRGPRREVPGGRGKGGLNTKIGDPRAQLQCAIPTIPPVPTPHAKTLLCRASQARAADARPAAGTRHVMASVQTAHVLMGQPPRTASHCGPKRQPIVATSSPRPMLCAGALYRWRHMLCFLSSDSSPIPSHAPTHPRTNLPARRHMLMDTPDAALQTQPPQTSFVRRAA